MKMFMILEMKSAFGVLHSISSPKSFFQSSDLWSLLMMSKYTIQKRFFLQHNESSFLADFVLHNT